MPPGCWKLAFALYKGTSSWIRVFLCTGFLFPILYTPLIQPLSVANLLMHKIYILQIMLIFQSSVSASKSAEIQVGKKKSKYVLNISHIQISLMDIPSMIINTKWRLSYHDYIQYYWTEFKEADNTTFGHCLFLPHNASTKRWHCIQTGDCISIIKLENSAHRDIQMLWNDISWHAKPTALSIFPLS